MQSSVLNVRDGSGVEGDWLFTGVLLTICIVLRRVNQQFHKTFPVQFVIEVSEDQETLRDANAYQRENNSTV